MNFIAFNLFSLQKDSIIIIIVVFFGFNCIKILVKYRTSLVRIRWWWQNWIFFSSHSNQIGNTKISFLPWSWKKCFRFFCFVLFRHWNFKWYFVCSIYRCCYYYCCGFCWFICVCVCVCGCGRKLGSKPVYYYIVSFEIFFHFLFLMRSSLLRLFFFFSFLSSF